MRWLREQAPELLPLVIAFVLPLAGVILALQAWLTEDHRRGLQILAAAVLGTFIWTAALTS